MKKRIYGIVKDLLYIVLVLCIFNVCVYNVKAGDLADEVDEMMEDDLIPEELQHYLNKQDYEVSYTFDGTGNETWFLINNLDGTRVKVSEINQIVNDAENYAAENHELSKKISRMRIAIIVLSVLLVLSVVLSITMCMVFKKRRHRRGKRTDSMHKNERRRINYDEFMDSNASQFKE